MLNDSEIPSEGTGTDKPMATDLEIHAICNGNGVSYSREVVLRLIGRLDHEIERAEKAERRLRSRIPRASIGGHADD